MCIKKGNTFECFWLFLRKQREGGGPKRGHVCSGWWAGLPLGRTTQRHSDRATAARVGAGGGSPPFLSSGPSHHGHHGKVRGAPAQSGLWEALAHLKALPREVWAETEGLEPAVLWAGAARSVLVFSESRQCQVRDRTGSLDLQAPRGPGRKVLLEPEPLFGSSWQPGCGAAVHPGGVAARGKGGAGDPGAGCWVDPRLFPGTMRQSQGHRGVLL